MYAQCYSHVQGCLCTNSALDAMAVLQPLPFSWTTSALPTSDHRENTPAFSSPHTGYRTTPDQASSIYASSDRPSPSYGYPWGQSHPSAGELGSPASRTSRSSLSSTHVSTTDFGSFYGASTSTSDPYLSPSLSTGLPFSQVAGSSSSPGQQHPPSSGPLRSPSTLSAARGSPVDARKKAVQCTLCPQFFGRPFDLQRHMQSVHAEEGKYCCDKCGRRFTRNDSMNRHKLKHHEDDNT
jgi:hypothetical protein